MFLLAWFAMFFSFFRTFLMRTDEAFVFVHTSVRIRPVSKNKPARQPVALRPCDIRVHTEASAARLRAPISGTPDILRGSYLAFASNLPFHRIIPACAGSNILPKT